MLEVWEAEEAVATLVVAAEAEEEVAEVATSEEAEVAADTSAAVVVSTPGAAVILAAGPAETASRAGRSAAIKVFAVRPLRAEPSGAGT
jgi:hypothetical protein